MDKIDKEALYNKLVKIEHDVMEKVSEYDKQPFSTDKYIEKLLFMRELNTISLIKYIVFDFPVIQEEGGPHEQS